MAYDFPPNIANLSLVDAIKVLILYFTGGTGTIPSGGSVPVAISQDTPGTTNGVVDKTSGTLSIFAKTAGQTETIPAGAFEIGVIFLTGTGTIGGVDWPAGIPFNLNSRTAATIAVVCGSPGTARVTYLT